MTLRGHSKEVTSVAFSPGGQRLVAGSRAVLKIWRLEKP